MVQGMSAAKSTACRLYQNQRFQCTALYTPVPAEYWLSFSLHQLDTQWRPPVKESRHANEDEEIISTLK
jgi:hypothetical protein